MAARYQQHVPEHEYDILDRNIGLPDEPFGPDEERIFIDDDVYDFDDSMVHLHQLGEKERVPVESSGNFLESNGVNDETIKVKKRTYHTMDYSRSERGTEHEKDKPSPAEAKEQLTHNHSKTKKKEESNHKAAGKSSKNEEAKGCGNSPFACNPHADKNLTDSLKLSEDRITDGEENSLNETTNIEDELKFLKNNSTDDLFEKVDVESQNASNVNFTFEEVKNSSTNDIDEDLSSTPADSINAGNFISYYNYIFDYIRL